MKKPTVTLATVKKVRRETAAILKQTDELRQRAKHAEQKVLLDYCPWEHGDVVELKRHKGGFPARRATIFRVEADSMERQKEPWMLVVNFHSQIGKPLKARSYIWPREYEIKLAPAEAPQPARFRPSVWINLKTEKEMFGIQASVQKGKWLHAREDGKPLVFATAKERDAKLKELRAAVKP